jgi:hypothetical protein
MDEIKAAIDSLRNNMNGRFDQVAAAINRILEENGEMKERIAILEQKIERMESEKRRKNVIVFGLANTESEEITTEKVVEEFLTSIKCDTQIVNAVRLPSKNMDKPIKITFMRDSEKKKFIETVKRSADNSIYTKPDLPKEVREYRRKLAKFYQEYKEQGKKVNVKYNILYIDGVGYKYNYSTGRLEKIVKKSAEK